MAVVEILKWRFYSSLPWTSLVGVADAGECYSDADVDYNDDNDDDEWLLSKF